jgi:hypothetical protein
VILGFIAWKIKNSLNWLRLKPLNQ